MAKSSENRVHVWTKIPHCHLCSHQLSAFQNAENHAFTLLCTRRGWLTWPAQRAFNPSLHGVRAIPAARLAVPKPMLTGSMQSSAPSSTPVLPTSPSPALPVGWTGGRCHPAQQPSIPQHCKRGDPHPIASCGASQQPSPPPGQGSLASSLQCVPPGAITTAAAA